jgi:hypothetical protein
VEVVIVLALHLEMPCLECLFGYGAVRKLFMEKQIQS